MLFNKFAKKEKIIEISSVSVVKEKKLILNSIFLEISGGEHTVLLGPNGSGKSTLLKLITKEYYPIKDTDENSYIRLFGKNEWDIFLLRNRIGILSDNFNKLYNLNITGREVLLSGFFSSYGVYSCHKIEKKMNQKVDEILNFLEIKELAEKSLENLSSGEINRFLLGRALVNDPEVLILDEPTVNLDIRSSHKFLSYIRELAKKNTTIIIVTHNLTDIIPEIKKVIMLKEGRIIYNGEKENGLNSVSVSSLFDIKVEVLKSGDNYALRVI